MSKGTSSEFIKFLGTAGARFVMIKQLRASGGVWICAQGENILLDPGPGSIVRCASSRPKLDPARLDALILSHRHLDHCGDINVMIEAMTEGGFKRKGTLFCPQDALKEDTVILKHLKNFPERIEILKPRRTYSVGDFQFQTSMQHIHPVETYGIKFKIKQKSISFLTDTRYFKGLNKFYSTDILVISVPFFSARPAIDHLSLSDVEVLAKDIKPQKLILTHFGMNMLKAKPHIQAEQLQKTTGVKVAAAYDGMTLDFS